MDNWQMFGKVFKLQLLADELKNDESYIMDNRELERDKIMQRIHQKAKDVLEVNNNIYNYY